MIRFAACITYYTYHLLYSQLATLHLILNLLLYYLPVQIRVAGFGFQVPSGETPSDVHTAVIVPVGTNPVLHLKNILAPSSVLGMATMEPLSGARGIPQLTGKNVIACNAKLKKRLRQMMM